MSSPITNVPTSGNLSMRLRHIIDNIDHINRVGNYLHEQYNVYALFKI